MVLRSGEHRKSDTEQDLADLPLVVGAQREGAHVQADLEWRTNAASSRLSTLRIAVESIDEAAVGAPKLTISRASAAAMPASAGERGAAEDGGDTHGGTAPMTIASPSSASRARTIATAGPMTLALAWMIPSRPKLSCRWSWAIGTAVRLASSHAGDARTAKYATRSPKIGGARVSASSSVIAVPTAPAANDAVHAVWKWLRVDSGARRGTRRFPAVGSKGRLWPRRWRLPCGRTRRATRAGPGRCWI